MKAKTIKSVLKKKFNEFVESIEDEGLRKEVKENTIITGGCIASMLLAEKVNDYDLYFRTKAVAKKVAEYYIKQFSDNPPPKFKAGGSVKIYVDEIITDRVKIVIKSAGIAGEGQAAHYQYFEQLNPDSSEAEEYVEQMVDNIAEEKEDARPYRPIFLSSNAITLSDKVQLIFRFHGEPDEIHENYDFVHCTNYWTSWDEKLVLRQDALEALLARELRYVGSRYPLCSIIRTRKFIQRQWTINAGQYLKMAMQLNELDLTNVSVLEDQLVGVDTAYFIQIIDALKDKDKEKVDSAYLMTIIDRIF